MRFGGYCYVYAMREEVYKVMKIQQLLVLINKISTIVHTIQLISR